MLVIRKLMEYRCLLSIEDAKVSQPTNRHVETVQAINAAILNYPAIYFFPSTEMYALTLDK